MKILLAALSFGALFAQQVPRPEYPQPQFQRDQWMTLNGKWDFEFDDANAGVDSNWVTSNKAFTKNITVPFCFESKMSGIGDTAFHPYVWYKRTFQTPAGWAGKRVLLHFGAVDYKASVWVNGQMAGEHEGGSTPFRFDVTPYLKSGANTVTVRAEDIPTDRFQPRGKQYWEPKSRGIFYTRTTGIWQPVWLEATGSSYLEKVRITPSNDGTVKFEARIARPKDGQELHATIDGGVKASGPAKSMLAAIAAQVADPQLWTPGSPKLYNVTFELKQGGQVLDTVHSYFGFRSIGVEKGRMTLNGRPIYIKMVLDQGYWPESTLTPPTDEAMQYDIRMTKQMGFNGARKHQKLEDPRFLYWADKMGFLVSSEAANAYLFDETYAARFQKEFAESVERDYNHPSIVMWVPINESWGVPNLRDPRQQQHLRAMYTLTKSLDATRPVIDNDGWEHTDSTDLFAIHDYARNGELLYEKYKGMGKTVPDNARPALAPGFKYNGTPVLLSEFGGIAFINPGSNVPESAWGYSGVEKTAEDALARLKSIYEGIAKLPFAGICYTQITDVEQEINGLMTYDRKMKFDAKAIKALNDMLK